MNIEPYLYGSTAHSYLKTKCYEGIDQLLQPNYTKIDHLYLLKASLNYPNKCPDFEMFEYIAKKIDIDDFNERGYTILMELVSAGNGAIYQNDRVEGSIRRMAKEIEMVLKYTKNINLENPEGYTALDKFIQRGSRDVKILFPILKLLLQNGANPFLPGKYGTHINLYFNSDDNCIEIIDFILKYATCEIKINNLTLTIAFYITDDSYDLVELLLPYVEDINEKDEKGRNILYHAKCIAESSQDLIDLLIENGARE